jgi:hypothetical protein
MPFSLLSNEPHSTPSLHHTCTLRDNRNKNHTGIKIMRDRIGALMHTYKKLICIGVGVCALGLSTIANAEYITYTYSGKVTGGPGGLVPPPPWLPIPPNSFPISELPTGFDDFTTVFAATISGYITVNTVGVDSNASPDRAQYGGAVTVPLFYLNFLGETFSFDYRAIRPATTALVTVSNVDVPQSPGGPVSNYIEVRAFLGTGIFSDPIASRFSVSLAAIFNTFDPNIITSNALPSELSSYGSWLVALGIYDPVTGGSASYSTNVSLQRYVPVPEPSTLSLLSFGLLMTGFAFSIGKRAYIGHPSIPHRLRS